MELLNLPVHNMNVNLKDEEMNLLESIEIPFN